MPTYNMKDPDGVEHEFLCSIADMEKKKTKGGLQCLVQLKII